VAEAVSPAVAAGAEAGTAVVTGAGVGADPAEADEGAVSFVEVIWPELTVVFVGTILFIANGTAWQPINEVET
jgi:hypothetical protein